MIPVKLKDTQSEQDLSHLSKQELNCFVCMWQNNYGV